MRRFMLPILGAVALSLTACGGGTTGVEDAIKSNLVGPGAVHLWDVNEFSPTWKVVWFMKADGTGYLHRSEDSGSTWCQAPAEWSVDTALTTSEDAFVLDLKYTTDACAYTAGTIEKFQFERLGNNNNYRFLAYFGELKDLSTGPQLKSYKCTENLSLPGGPCDLEGGSFGAGGLVSPLGSPYAN